MPNAREKSYKRYLSGDDILHVRMVIEKGLVIEFAIAYELIVDGISYQPCRIDNAHGEVHIDAFRASGERLPRAHLGKFNERTVVSDAMEKLLEVIDEHRTRVLRELGIEDEDEGDDGQDG